MTGHSTTGRITTGHGEPPPELAGLLQMLVDGSISAEDHRRLEQLLGEDEQARKHFLDFMQLHALLQWGAVELSGTPDEGSQVDSDCPRFLPAPIDPPSAIPWRLITLTTLFPMVLLVAALCWLALPRHEQVARLPAIDHLQPARDEYVGILRFVDNLKWQDDNLKRQGRAFPTRVGQAIPGGRMQLLSGTAQIELFDGAMLTLKGPADFSCDTSAGGFLHSGRLLVSILREDAEVQIATPVGELIHLGTEFGVSVDPAGNTQMYVFEGLVELRAGVACVPVGSTHLIAKGASIEVKSTGQMRDLGKDSADAFLASIALPRLSTPSTRRPPSVSEEGFTVRYVKSASAPIDNLAAADALLSGRLSSSEDLTVRGVQRIDFEDSTFDPVYLNCFEHDEPYPGDDGGDDREENDDAFVIRATATLIVSEHWQYSFLVNADDGARLRIDGKDLLRDDGVHPPQVSIGVAILARGEHTLELVYYEDSGFARVELATAPGKTIHIEDFSLLTTGAETAAEAAIPGEQTTRKSSGQGST